MIVASGTIVHVSGSVNGGWFARATCQTEVRYMTGIIRMANSIPSLPSCMWTECLRAEMSWVCATMSAIQIVNTVP